MHNLLALSKYDIFNFYSRFWISFFIKFCQLKPEILYKLHIYFYCPLQELYLIVWLICSKYLIQDIFMIILLIFKRKSQLLNLFISRFAVHKIEDYFKFIFIVMSIFLSIFKGFSYFYQIQGKFIGHFFINLINILQKYCRHGFYVSNDG